MVGVLLPSMDRVGRSFPLVIAAKLGSFNGHPRLLCFDEPGSWPPKRWPKRPSARDFDIAGFQRTETPAPAASQGSIEQRRFDGN